MNNTYGYFLGTLGKDKDHIDVFINDAVDLDKFNGTIYVIDQVNKDGTFDEHKVMYGFRIRPKQRKHIYLITKKDGEVAEPLQEYLRKLLISGLEKVNERLSHSRIVLKIRNDKCFQSLYYQICSNN